MEQMFSSLSYTISQVSSLPHTEDLGPASRSQTFTSEMRQCRRLGHGLFVLIVAKHNMLLEKQTSRENRGTLQWAPAIRVLHCLLLRCLGLLRNNLEVTRSNAVSKNAQEIQITSRSSNPATIVLVCGLGNFTRLKWRQ